MDDLVVRGGLFLGGLALLARPGKTGPMFGTITGTDFDTTSGIVLEAGSLQVSSALFTLGVASAQAIRQSGGDLMVAASQVFVGTPSRAPAIELSAGHLAISASVLTSNSFDVTAIAETGSQAVLSLNGDIFDRTPNHPYAAPTIDLRAGRTVAMGNYASDKGLGAGIFMRIGNDNPFNRIIGNASPGWPSYAPVRRQGTYLFN